MPAGLFDDAGDDVDAVAAAVERERRLVAAFRRQRRHALGVDIGRIGDDEVVALVRDRREEIAAQEGDALAEPVLAHIARRDFEGIRRNIDGIDGGVGKAHRGEHGERARSGAEIEHARDLVRVLPGKAVVAAGKSVAGDELAEIGTRHDHPLVDVKRDAGGIDASEEIGGRLAGRDPRFDEGEDARALGRGDPRRRKPFEPIGRQVQRFADDEGRLGHRIGGAVGEHELRFGKARHRIAHEIEHGDEFHRIVQVVSGGLCRPALRLASLRWARGAAGSFDHGG